MEEEADETIYWLELLIESQTVEVSRVNLLLKESNEIVAMVVASIKHFEVDKVAFPLQSKIKNLKSKIENHHG